MFYVFYIKDGILYSGLTVYGDYAPHTAMMRSFSAGNNFPTQYPHYGGAAHQKHDHPLSGNEGSHSRRLHRIRIQHRHRRTPVRIQIAQDQNN